MIQCNCRNANEYHTDPCRLQCCIYTYSYLGTPTLSNEFATIAALQVNYGVSSSAIVTRSGRMSSNICHGRQWRKDRSAHAATNYSDTRTS